MASIIALPYFAERPTTEPYHPSVVTLLCAVALFLAAFDQNIFTPGERSRRAVAYFGSRAYSMYLSNFLVYHLVRYFAAESAVVANPYVFLALSLAAILAAAELSYRYIEVPMMRIGYDFFSLSAGFGRSGPAITAAGGIWVGMVAVLAWLQPEDGLLKASLGRMKTYLAPKIEGRPVDVTPLSWQPQQMPAAQAVAATARQLCRYYGNNDAVAYAVKTVAPQDVARFARFDDFEARPFDAGRAIFSRIHCAK